MGSGVNDAKAVEREIDGVTYEMRRLSLIAARNGLLRAGGVARAMMTGSVGSMVSGLSTEDLDYFARLFGEHSHYRDGEKWVPLLFANHEKLFDDRLSAYFAWILFGMEVNFASFFADGLLTKAIDSLKVAVTPKST